MVTRVFDLIWASGLRCGIALTGGLNMSIGVIESEPDGIQTTILLVRVSGEVCDDILSWQRAVASHGLQYLGSCMMESLGCSGHNHEAEYNILDMHRQERRQDTVS